MEEDAKIPFVSWYVYLPLTHLPGGLPLFAWLPISPSEQQKHIFLALTLSRYLTITVDWAT